MTLFEDTPVLCGHRGSGQGIVDGHRENTLASCLAAVDHGLPWVEIDARITADDVLVARHDAATDDGRFLDRMPAAETDALGLARVADLLAGLPPDVAVDIDVKSSLEDALRPRERTTAALVADLVTREAAARRVLVSSFDPAVLLIVRERAPAVALGLITWLRFPLRQAIAAAVHLGAGVVAPHVESFQLEPEPHRAVEIAHAAGLEVAAWCPAPDERALLIEAGVDCLVVDGVSAARPAAWPSPPPPG